MTATPSNMLPLGTKAPDFKLYDAIDNKLKSLTELKSDVATVIMFICNHCPFVKHLQLGLVAVAKQYQEQNIAFIAINANDAGKYPEDSPERMQDVALEVGYSFPYLFDDTQEVAKAYEAACTPDFYIFDHELHCVYRGQFDDSRPGNAIPVTGKDISTALDAILNHKPVNPIQKPSIGCNIKWR